MKFRADESHNPTKFEHYRIITTEVRTSRVVERGAAETSSRRRPVTWSCAWTDGHRKPF